MSKQQEFFEIVKQLGGSGFLLTTPRIFIQITGDMESAHLLSQCLYWSDRSALADGWFWKTSQDWSEELALSDYRVRKAIGRLRELGILTTDLRKVNGAPTLHFHIEEEVLVALISQVTENENREPRELDLSNLAKSNSRPSRNPTIQRLLSENTAETSGRDLPEPNGSGTTATATSSTSKKPKTKRKVDARLQHPAVKVWSTMAEKPTYILNGAQRDMIINAVGNSSSNLEEWKLAVRAWMGHGYKPTDVINQLDFWRKGKWRDGRTQKDGRGNGRDAGTAGGSKGKSATPEQLAATRAYLKRLEVLRKAALLEAAEG